MPSGRGDPPPPGEVAQATGPLGAGRVPASCGGGALLGFVDIILELYGVGRLQSDERRRRLIGLSRQTETPRQLVYQWDPATGEFATVGDLFATVYKAMDIDPTLQIRDNLGRPLPIAPEKSTPIKQLVG